MYKGGKRRGVLRERERAEKEKHESSCLTACARRWMTSSRVSSGAISSGWKKVAVAFNGCALGRVSRSTEVERFEWDRAEILIEKESAKRDREGERRFARSVRSRSSSLPRLCVFAIVVDRRKSFFSAARAHGCLIAYFSGSLSILVCTLWSTRFFFFFLFSCWCSGKSLCGSFTRRAREWVEKKEVERVVERSSSTSSA